MFNAAMDLCWCRTSPAVIGLRGKQKADQLVYFAKGEPRNVEYGKFFLWKYNIWVLRTRKLPDAKFLSIAFCVIDLISMLIR